MFSKVIRIVVISVVMSVAYCDDAIEYEEIEALDNIDDDDKSNESVSGENFEGEQLPKYEWVREPEVSMNTSYTEAISTVPVLVGTTIRTSPDQTKGNLMQNVVANFSQYSHSVKPPIHDFKFAVSIQRKGAHYATGALIDTKWVITSAKEFYNVRESIKLFRLRIGTTDCKRGGVLIPIKEILVHPTYKYGDVTNDVALLRLAVPLEADRMDEIEPIQLAQYKECNKFISTYWPRVFVNNTLLPASAPERVKYSHIRVSTQNLIPWKECFKSMATKNISLHDTSLCLKPIVVRHSPCMPDAGAPVLSSDGLWGVTSGWKAPDCGQDPSPVIVTRTSAPAIHAWLKKWTSSPLWNLGATD